MNDTNELNNYIVLYEVSGQKFITTSLLNLNQDDLILCDTPYGIDLCKVLKKLDNKDYNFFNVRIINSYECEKKDIEENIDDNTHNDEYISFLKTEIENQNLDMKILTSRVMYKTVDDLQNINSKKFIVFFNSKDRVDFRKLVKSFNKQFQGVYIQFRQLVQKEIAPCVGGVGSCGRVLCCCSLKSSSNNCLTRKIAKKENIKIDEFKNIGHCESIKCCMAYEQE